MLNKELLDMLACPKCKGTVVLEEKETGLICKNCKLIFPILEGIPVMLPDEAAAIS